MILTATTLLASLLLAQDPAPSQATEAKAVYDEAQKAADAVTMPTERSREAVVAWRAERLKPLQQALAEHDDVLSQGDGLHYKGLLLIETGDRDGALEVFAAHAEDSSSGLRSDSLVVLASLQSRDKDKVAELLASVKADQLSEKGRGIYYSLTADETREGLTGKLVPTIQVLKAVNAQAEPSVEAARGKVLLLDFWATWCPPCRAVIPGIVELKEKHGDDMAVLGVTRYYGYGMDFAGSDVTLPHGGETVGSRDKPIDEAKEVEINETFAEVFDLNYPIVFTGTEVAARDFGVRGIPTVFVVGKDGVVVGSIVGGGEKNHAELEKLIEQALLAPTAVEADSKKKQ